MAVVEELIRVGNNETLSFGNYKLDKKSKLDNFEFGGDLYKVKTFKEITEYKVMVNSTDSGQMKTNLGGKLSLSVELSEDAPVSVVIKKIG